MMILRSKNGDKPTNEKKMNMTKLIQNDCNSFSRMKQWPSNCGGSVQQIQLESALGIKTGELDTTQMVLKLLTMQQKVQPLMTS